jgi:shikimate dehydrogenase
MRAAVIGYPISHSLSPVLHRAAYDALGLAGWTYEAVAVTESDLPAFVANLDSGWAGLSVTMPHKVALAGLVHHVEPLAEVIGVINTVLVQPGDPLTLVGANTDVYGVVQALAEVGVHRGSQPRAAVLLGGGATAASTIAALAQLGLSAPVVRVRSMARAAATMRAAHTMGATPRFTLLGEYREVVEQLRTADVVVSTLPPHAADGLAIALQESSAQVGGVLLDCAYDPHPTALVTTWRHAGGTAVGGERMLLHQAAEQVRLMTGRPAPVDAMGDALALAMAGGSPGRTTGA